MINVFANLLLLFICFGILGTEMKKAHVFSGLLFTMFLVFRRLIYNLYFGLNQNINFFSVIAVVLIFIFSTIYFWLLKEKSEFWWVLIILLISWVLAPLK